LDKVSESTLRITTESSTTKMRIAVIVKSSQLNGSRPVRS
jgi:hypothetical protein